MRRFARYSLQFGFLFMLGASFVQAQPPRAPSALKVLGTRSWIRLTWQDNAPDKLGYHIYWRRSGDKRGAAVDKKSAVDKPSAGASDKPSVPGASVPADRTRYYITPVEAQSAYTVWVEAYNADGSSRAVEASVVTLKDWTLDSLEAVHLSTPSSQAVPAGMRLFWQDEFNDALLNRNKWTTGYYSTIDFKDSADLSAMLADTLPQAGYVMTDSTIDLITDDRTPGRFFWPGRKVSSIQTYDWSTGENLLDNSRGGYYEVRVRRRNTPSSLRGVNCAYWFDSPGPDLKYYMEQGNTAYGVTGVRPHGQAFEIDVFEENGTQPHTTPFTLHGHVAADGTFQGHLATYNAPGNFQNDWVVHGLLWTPTGIQYYINGVLQHEWADSGKVMSPNHFMNILLGVYGAWAYGNGNSAHMEVDYIRGYQWPVGDGNELPNPGFEYSNALYPWEGTGAVSSSARTGKHGAVLAPGQWVDQYVYLNNGKKYKAGYWFKGVGSLQVEVENVKAVSLARVNAYRKSRAVSSVFKEDSLDFTTTAAYGNDMQTVRLRLMNTGPGTITIDDITLVKGGGGGHADF